jgi:alkane 1-monooxygenase
MKRSFYLLAFTVPLSIFLSFYLKGWWSYLSLVYTFVFLPLLELVLPVFNANLRPEEEVLWKSDKYFDGILWLMVPLQYGLLIYFCSILSHHSLESFEVIGLVSAMGIGCGVLGINVAHELGHRNNLLEQTMAKMLLSTSLYWHFFIEHNKGHHKNVSTPYDPESSRLNEVLYSFWFRSIKDSFLSAVKIDRKQMFLALFLQSILILTILLIWGSLAMWGFLASAAIGIILLESVNYIEHYGLSRKEIAPGRYEKVRPEHSWNADNPLSRAVLFDLSRHSDHHANVARKYQLLQHFDASPQMPTGYPGMILLSLIPPLWFKVMNKKISNLT